MKFFRFLLIWTTLTAPASAADYVAGPSGILSSGAVLKLSPRGYIHTWMPGIIGIGTGSTGVYSNAAGGHVGMMGIEAPDDFYAVRIIAFNQAAASWSISQIVAQPSSTWGPTAVPGSTAYDPSGAALTLALPFTFGNGGANGSPLGASMGTVSGQPRAPILALATNGTSADNSHLSFSSISTNTYLLNGSGGISNGWFVADGLGCITPGTTVSSLASPTTTLTGNQATTLCQSGQQIWFSSTPFPSDSGTTFTWGTTVPASPNSTTGRSSYAFSDWLSVGSFDRSDGGLPIGGTVSGTNIPAGTTLASTTYNSIQLSKSITGTVASAAAIAVSVSTTTTVSNIDTLANSGTLDYKLYVASTRGLKRGQIVTDTSAACPATTIVTEVASAYVRVNSLCPAPLGDVLTFTQTINTNASTASGSSLPVLSTSNNPLLMLRYFLGTTNGPAIWQPPTACSFYQCEQVFGAPLTVAAFGGQNTGVAIDGVNFVSLVGAGAGGAVARIVAPTILVQFLSRRRGLVTMQCGGFQSSGAYTASRAINAMRRATAQYTAAGGVPSSSVNVGFTGPSNVTQEYCRQLIQIAQPDIVGIWGYSDSAPESTSDYEATVKALEETASAQGSRVILETDAPESSTKIGALVTGAASSSSTTLNLAMSPFYTGSGYLITGPGIPAGTTITLNGSAVPFQGTLSQAASVPAGSTVYLDYQAGASSSGTTVTLAFPSPVETGTFSLTGTGVPVGTTITVTQNSTTATLNQAATITNGQTLTIYKIDASTNVIAGKTSGDYLSLVGPGSTVTVADMGLTTYVYDPLHPLFKCPACSTSGIYNNDYAEGLWANYLQTIIKGLVGSN